MGVNSSWFTHNWAIIPLFDCARQAVIVISIGKVNGCLKSFDLKDISIGKVNGCLKSFDLKDIFMRKKKKSN